MAPTNLPGAVILVASSLGPAELLEYRDRLVGLVLEEGSPSSHVALICRALGIPTLGRCREATRRIEPLDELVVDSERGHVFVRPGDEVAAAYRRDIASRLQRRERDAALRHAPTLTRDGHRVRLFINAALLIELGQLDSEGADGVGLYRTEIPFMIQSAFPDTRSQADLYGEALRIAGDRPVVFRTLDVGADKHLPFFPHVVEPNPALGWRAIRLGIDRPSILTTQLRALVQASAGRVLRVMFPMVAEVAELVAARALLDRALDWHTAQGGEMPSAVEVGTMVEVPSLLFQLDAVCRLVDFLSVGTNDLLQFLFAADRENPALAQRFDSLSPAMLVVLDRLRRTAEAHRVPVTVCGEMAGRPLEAMALVGLGFDRLSMAGPTLAPVRRMLRGLDRAALADYLYRQMDDAAAHTLRPRLRAYAGDHGIELEGQQA